MYYTFNGDVCLVLLVSNVLLLNNVFVLLKTSFAFQFTNLSAAEQKMATAVGVPESFVARKAAGQSVRKVDKNSIPLKLHIPFSYD